MFYTVKKLRSESKSGLQQEETFPRQHHPGDVFGQALFVLTSDPSSDDESVQHGSTALNNSESERNSVCDGFVCLEKASATGIRTKMDYL